MVFENFTIIQDWIWLVLGDKHGRRRCEERTRMEKVLIPLWVEPCIYIESLAVVNGFNQALESVYHDYKICN